MRLARLVVITFLLTNAALGKGNGIGFWLEGKVRDVNVNDQHMHFSMEGRFWMTQYREGSSQLPDRIEVPSSESISATVTQWKEFFAMTTDWGGGALRGDGELLKLLSTASEKGSVIRLELLNPELQFPSSLNVIVKDAAIIRATDHELR